MCKPVNIFVKREIGMAMEQWRKDLYGIPIWNVDSKRIGVMKGITTE